MHEYSWGLWCHILDVCSSLFKNHTAKLLSCSGGLRMLEEQGRKNILKKGTTAVCGIYIQSEDGGCLVRWKITPEGTFVVCFQTWVHQCFPVRSKLKVKEELSVLLIFKGQLWNVLLHQIQLILQEPIGRQAGKANEKQLTDAFVNLGSWPSSCRSRARYTALTYHHLIHWTHQCILITLSLLRNSFQHVANFTPDVRCWVGSPRWIYYRLSATAASCCEEKGGWELQDWTMQLMCCKKKTSRGKKKKKWTK